VLPELGGGGEEELILFLFHGKTKKYNLDLQSPNPPKYLGRRTHPLRTTSTQKPKLNKENFNSNNSLRDEEVNQPDH
jgi:hypothetical protein